MYGFKKRYQKDMHFFEIGLHSQKKLLIIIDSIVNINGGIYMIIC